LDADVSGSFVLRSDNPLNDITGVYPKDEYTLSFYLKNGKVGPPNDYINITTSDQPNAVVDQTNLVDKARGNVPLANNRKVQMTYGDGLDGKMKAIPNPASPDPLRVREDGKKVEAGKIFADHDGSAVRDIRDGYAGGTVFEVSLFVPRTTDSDGNPISRNDPPRVMCQLKVYDLAGNLVISGQSNDAMGGTASSGDTKLHLYWNGYNAKKMKVAPGTYRMVVYISYKGTIHPDDKQFAKDKKYTGLVGISK